MKLKMLLIAGAACAMAGTAFAQSRDTSGDRVTDKAGYVASLKASFEKKDTNKDGKLTLGEQAAAGELGSVVGQAELAAQGADHVVMTLEQLLAGSESAFAERDSNKDGFIDRAELAASLRPLRDMMADGKVDKAERLAQSRAQFERPDTDKDGKVGSVTLADALATSAAIFDRSDTNKDGFITTDEAQAAALASIAQHAGRQNP